MESIKNILDEAISSLSTKQAEQDEGNRWDTVLHGILRDQFFEKKRWWSFISKSKLLSNWSYDWNMKMFHRYGTYYETRDFVEALDHSEGVLHKSYNELIAELKKPPVAPEFCRECGLPTQKEYLYVICSQCGKQIRDISGFRISQQENIAFLYCGECYHKQEMERIKQQNKPTELTHVFRCIKCHTILLQLRGDSGNIIEGSDLVCPQCYDKVNQYPCYECDCLENGKCKAGLPQKGPCAVFRFKDKAKNDGVTTAAEVQVVYACTTDTCMHNRRYIRQECHDCTHPSTPPMQFLKQRKCKYYERQKVT